MSNDRNISEFAKLSVALVAGLWLALAAGDFAHAANASVYGNLNLNSLLGIGGGNGGGTIARALCEIVGWFNGPVGSAIASLAVIFVGISAFFGKANWGTVLTLVAGITAMFSAGDIVQAVTGMGSQCCGGGNISVSLSIGPISACASF